MLFAPQISNDWNFLIDHTSVCTVQLRDRVQVRAPGPDLQLYEPRPDPGPNLPAGPRPLLQY